MPNKNKTVLISGGTSGIGWACVFKLLAAGFNMATFSPDRKKVAALDKELSVKYSRDRFLAMAGDVTSEMSVKNVAARVMKHFRSIDILMNNAGIGYFSDCDNLDLKKFRRMLEVNTVGVASLTKAVVPFMKKKRSGLIINLVSIAGRTAMAQGEFYSASKFGAFGYAEGVRNELKPFGIKVATICPGMVYTDFLDLAHDIDRRKKLNHGRLPMMLNVEDVASVVALICSQSAHCEIRDVVLMPF